MEQRCRRRRKPSSRRANSVHDGEINPSTAPPPPPRVPGWMEPPLHPPPPATTNATWLILDRFVHYSRRRRGVIQGDATTSSLAEDCAGRHVRVSLRIADPPAVSRLYLHWPGRPHTDLPFSKPIAIAAHRSSILFRMTVPFDDDTWWHDTPSFPVEHFVYSSSSSSSLSPPSLISLPPCFYGGDIDPVLDKFFQQHRRQRQRIMFNAEMGIICHGGDHGEFTVAHLCHHQLELCLLHHLPSAGGPSMEWSLYKLQISPDMKIDLDSWRTDVVVPIGRSLCWVDYYQGMLLVDVLGRYHRQPSFPVMTLVDPDVICFLLIKEQDCNRTWMVEVNMRSKVMLSSALYINEEEEEGHPSAKDCTKGFYGHYFITTKFSSYLSKDAITSRHAAASHRKKLAVFSYCGGKCPPRGEQTATTEGGRSRPHHRPDEARRLTPAAAARPPPPPPATTSPSWLILDCRRCRGIIHGDATTSSLAEDCAGRHVRVSLRIAGTPAASRLHLHLHGARRHRRPPQLHPLPDDRPLRRLLCR
ncbi:hypothetical protein HU200_065188 [Digitaria exilis]|uniref:DUF1618 domain-containing protein n=1 Tax=Digitaria exilis TaxID=1010633 RepID=A0A835DY27_9POAL|nr:hypothetical protein HU200_065188 [Digitaria exilis]